MELLRLVGFPLCLLLLSSRCLTASGYDLGEDITLCWVGSAESESTPQREDCAGASISFNSAGPDDFIAGVSYAVTYVAHIPAGPHDLEIVHANIHSCNRNVGFCTPFVKNTPELSTHSVALTATLQNHFAVIVSTVSLPAGQYTMIAHAQWKESDGTVHDLARARVFDVRESIDPVIYGLIAMGVALFLVVFCILGYGVYHLVRYFRRLRGVAKRAYQQRVLRVLQAYKQTKRLAYPMVCMSYSDFKDQGKMISHETARAQRLLRHFDTVAAIAEAEKSYNIVFVSHQWTCSTHPDPKGTQFNAICDAITAIADPQDLDEKNGSTKPFLVWLDYTSIPQKASALQNLSINSLPIYASFSSHFLVVAPSVQNWRNGPAFTYHTYETRGWCRLEQWARITQRGIDNIFICKGSEEERGPAVPAVQDMEFADTAMRIFQGDFTEEEDRDKLIDTMVGLYVMLLEESSSAYQTALLKKVQNNLAEVFPVAHFEDLITIADALVVNNRVPSECTGEDLDIVIGKIMRSSISSLKQEQKASLWGRVCHRSSLHKLPRKQVKGPQHLPAKGLHAPLDAASLM